MSVSDGDQAAIVAEVLALLAERGYADLSDAASVLGVAAAAVTSLVPAGVRMAAAEDFARAYRSSVRRTIEAERMARH